MPVVSVEQRGATAIVTFDRPPVNAFDLAFLEEFHRRVHELAEDPPQGGVVVTGAGRVFSAGIDFKAVPAYTDPERAEAIGHINATVTALYGLPTCTVAAVNGHAIGGALVMALACDVRLASDGDAKLGLTEVTAGIPYPACPIEVLRAELDPAYRRHLVLSGELIDPTTALRHGLLDELLPADQLLEAALARAQRQAAAPAYAQVKQQLKRETLRRMRQILDTQDDPLLDHWV